MPAKTRGLISPEDIAKVRAASDLLALAEECTLVKKVGANWFARCVFHDDRNPSLHLDPVQGIYYCFSCKVAGDVIKFYEHVKGLSFPAAVEELANRAGIELTFEESEEAKRARLHRNRLHETVGEAAGWYHEQLLSNSEAAEARRYLKTERKIDSAAAARFGIGWAPRQPGALVRGLRLDPKVAEESGLLLRGRSDPLEALRGRIVFPIHTPDGKPCALAGRIMPGEEGASPKYVNFSETDIYAKRRVLYGLDLAKKSIVAADEAVVCEGYMDVIGCHLAGVDRAVATCGVALTEDHVTALGRFARRIVMAFDADGAGQDAMEGILRWERSHRVRFYVARLPEGTDPGQLYEEGRHEELREAIASAQPFLGWRLDRMFAVADLSTPEGRVTAADQAMEAVCDHPDQRVAAQYLDVIAERCHVDVEPLRRQLEAHHARAAKQRERESAKPKEAVTPPAELEALRLAVREPVQVADWLEGCLFSDVGLRRAFEALAEGAQLADAISAHPGPIGSLLGSLEVAEPAGDAMAGDALRHGLVVAAGRRALADMAFGLREPDAHAWVRATVETLAEDGDESAFTQLHGWLAARDPGLPDEPEETDASEAAIDTPGEARVTAPAGADGDPGPVDSLFEEGDGEEFEWPYAVDGDDSAEDDLEWPYPVGDEA